MSISSARTLAYMPSKIASSTTSSGLAGKTFIRVEIRRPCTISRLGVDVGNQPVQFCEIALKILLGKRYHYRRLVSPWGGP